MSVANHEHVKRLARSARRSTGFSDFTEERDARNMTLPAGLNALLGTTLERGARDVTWTEGTSTIEPRGACVILVEMSFLERPTGIEAVHVNAAQSSWRTTRHPGVSWCSLHASG